MDGAYLEIAGDDHERYLVKIEDLDEPDFIMQREVEAGQWIRTPHRYFVRWRVNVFSQADNSLLYHHTYDCQNKRVYIAFESSSLGDTLAWLPAVEEFRKRHHCHMICSTYLNDLFRENYPEIEFIAPGETAHDLYAMYRIGLFYKEDGEYDYSKNPTDFREQPLAQPAFDILGLPFSEIKPLISIPDLPRLIDKPYVCIGLHATCQAKYWNNPKGWDEVVRFLRYKGYNVVLLSKEGKKHMGNSAPQGVKCLQEGGLETVINYLRHAKLFIGVGSGLSWLSWATGCRTCLISGFSYPYAEMQDCIRIFPPGGVCSGCFNRYRLDASNWDWCPDHKETPRMFECTRLISGRQVISAISPYL
ncbi:autotransporter strand-loop-strand O-heptosyltransferase [Methylomicrobium sp. Wu6]|uniref:autotransporter strand-loop-strand O-heptosyltransferase n=1 Tax=Methylomicrobium sp. Wu6 TaxID=3107928 RepID=UPI002DD63F9B|nr:autotransporter strand-loop-strand O-heptosyltransferase [Methylomicrobium sp. Wu6]MEC4750490.1 autotransporter strand-loop-strand O-heptosyltransferase [Methylomicrobium sp. Wu6]